MRLMDFVDTILKVFLMFHLENTKIQNFQKLKCIILQISQRGQFLNAKILYLLLMKSKEMILFIVIHPMFHYQLPQFYFILKKGF